MPYVTIWISDATKEELLKLACAQERDTARIDNRKPQRVTLKGAVGDCFSEGMEDLHARASDFMDGDEDDD